MQITIVGSGYVGLVAGACFAESGNAVTCVDVDAEKIARLRRGEVPIYEPGLEVLIARNAEAGRLQFDTDVAAAVAEAAVVIIAVGTPAAEDGSADLQHVLSVAKLIGETITRETVVVTKSTVPVGTGDEIASVIDDALSARGLDIPVHVVSNPEFLKEGAAIDDFMKPDRVVIGLDSAHARQVMTELYAPFVRSGKPIHLMARRSAELTKYAANAMLAVRISFMNEMATLCDAVGADIDCVRKGIGSDSRIGSSFLFPGPGYGGSCFPKDVQALLRTASETNIAMAVVRAAEIANARQKHRVWDLLTAQLGTSAADLKGRRVAIWGLSFKANTDDMRESPSIALIDALLAADVKVVAHDPEALDEARRRFGDRIEYVTDAYDALVGADALCVMTDWFQYRTPSFDRMLDLMQYPVVIDGRNLYAPERMAKAGFEYASLGRPYGWPLAHGLGKVRKHTPNLGPRANRKTLGRTGAGGAVRAMLADVRLTDRGDGVSQITSS